jgi:ABC-type proline/glycine betaine transport system permease subunit
MTRQTKTVALMVLLCLACLIIGVAAGIEYTSQRELECQVDLITSQTQLLKCKVDLQEANIEQVEQVFSAN